MNKQTARRGFTITELVIVIVVIAILAAVLIPTFASLIKKANISADTQLARNLNTALSMAEAEGDKVDEFSEVLDAARDAGYIISNLNPTAKNCYFVWEKETNQFLLVDGEKDYKVIFAAEKDHPEIGETWYFATADKEVAEKLKADAPNYNNFNVMDMVADIQDFTNALTLGGTQELYIDESVVLDKNNLLVVDDPNANITLNLGNAALNTSGILVEDGENVVPVAIKKGTVTINGGVIAAAGAGVNFHNLPIKEAVHTEKGTTVTFNGTEFMNTSTAAQIRIAGTANMNDVVIDSSRIGVDTLSGGNLVLKDTTINVTNTGIANYRGSCVISCNFDGATHVGDSLVTIESGTYSTDGGDAGAIRSCGGDVVIKGGTFTAPAGKMFDVIHNNADITISGGTFNGVAFEDLTVEKLDAMTLSGTVSQVGNTFVISK